MCKNCKDVEIESSLLAMQLTGIFFGYPSCCIMWFIERARKIKLAIAHGEDAKEVAKLPKEYDRFTAGFLPCPECLKLLKPNQSEKDLIQQTRLCPTKYPFDHNCDKELDEFIQGAFT